MPTEIITCILRVKNETVERHLEDVILSMGGFRIKKNSDPATCDLMILEMGSEVQKDLDFARNALISNLTKNIFFTSSTVDPHIIIDVLNVGAKGFFRQPIDRDEVKTALLRIREQKEGQGYGKVIKRSKIINVFGAKGGVGATTVAVNLATSFLELEGVHSVALMDINRPFGDVPLFLNIERSSDWAEISKNIARLDATYLMSILFKHSSGLYVLPAPTTTLVEDNSMPQVMETLLKLMQGLFDYIIVDSGQSMDATSRSILKLTDRTIIVTVLTLSCLVNIKRFRELFLRLSGPPENMVDIVVNRLTKKNLISLDVAEETLGRKVLWTIPNDYHITMNAINQGKTLSSMDHGAEATVKVRGLAAMLAGKSEKKHVKKGFFGLQKK